MVEGENQRGQPGLLNEERKTHHVTFPSFDNLFVCLCVNLGEFVYLLDSWVGIEVEDAGGGKSQGKRKKEDNRNRVSRLEPAEPRKVKHPPHTLSF